MVYAGPLSSEDQSLVLVCLDICPFGDLTSCSRLGNVLLAMSLHF